MNFKKIIILFFIYILNISNTIAVEPNIFVQSTVNEVSAILSNNISKEEKVKKLKIIAKDTVDIKGVGYYSLGPIRKSLNEDHGKTILMVTHDPAAAESAKRSLHLDKGKLII